jgi:hypothetical protein
VGVLNETDLILGPLFQGAFFLAVSRAFQLDFFDARQAWKA